MLTFSALFCIGVVQYWSFFFKNLQDYDTGVGQMQILQS